MTIEKMINDSRIQQIITRFENKGVRWRDDRQALPEIDRNSV